MPKCHARSTRTGEQCRKDAMRGQEVCRFHGGASPQAKDAATRRLQEEQAAAVLRSRKIWNLDAEKVTDPMEELARYAGQVRDAREVVAVIMQAQDCVCCGAGQLDPAHTSALRELNKEFRQTLVDMKRLGLDEHRVRVHERQVDILLAGLIAGLAAAGIDGSNEGLLLAARAGAIATMRELEAQPMPAQQ